MSEIYLLQAADGDKCLTLGAFLSAPEALEIMQLCQKHNRLIRAHYGLYLHYDITTTGCRLPLPRNGYLDRLAALSKTKHNIHSNVSFIRLIEYAKGLEL